MIADFDAALVRRWLGILHGDAPGLLNIVSTGNWAGVTFPTDQLDRAVDYVGVQHRAGRAGIYLRVTTLREAPEVGRRSGADNTLSLPALWADLDLAGPGHAEGNLPPDVEAGQKVITVSALPDPTIWVHSGGGLYPIWLLAKPHVITDDLQDVSDLAAGWQKIIEHAAASLGWKYGAGVGDLARVLRIPGTVNRKPEMAEPQPCRIIAATANRYPLSALYEAMATGLAGIQPPAGNVSATSARAHIQTADGDLTPGDDYAARTDWADILQPHGWTLSHQQEAVRFWTRPGKRQGISATTNFLGTDRLHVFSTSTVFDANDSYSKMGALALLEHGGDHAATARALRSRGFGSPLPDLGQQNAEDVRFLMSAPPPAPAPRQTTAQPSQAPPASNPGATIAHGLFTDARMTERVARELLTGRYCWTAGLGWLVWDGRRWRECSDVTVGESVRQWCLERFVEAVKAGHTSKDDPIYGGWHSMLSGRREGAVVRLARGILERHTAEFDAYPDLLNAGNGVINLRTGDLHPHDPALMFTKLTAAEYQPGARHADWDQALRALPDDVATWMQFRLGQAITGHMTPDDVLVISQGGGENGKSTINETTARAVGDYFLLVSDRALMANPDAHPTELMDFRGARLAVLEETPEARRLDPQRLKRTVGTPRITARRIRQDSVTFEATHSLFISTNHRPLVEESDHGTWRRLLLVRFPYRFRKLHEALESATDRYGDPGLRDRCKTDPAVWTAALGWMVEGARRWYAADKVMPPPPAAVTQDTFGWRSESDLVLAYAADRLEFNRDGHIMTTDLLADFNDWVTARGHRPWSDRTLGGRMEGHEGFVSRGVEKRKIRSQPGLSRRSGILMDSAAYASPPTYAAWLGVIFTDGR